MAKVTIQAPRSVNSTIKAEALDAANWIADYLGIPEDYKIEIVLNTRRKRWSVARNLDGKAQVELATDLRGCTLESACSVAVLAHELVHCRQYANDELYSVHYDHQLRGWRKMWAGDERWGSAGEYVKGSGRGKTPYRKLPWEREAYGVMVEVADAYRNRNDNDAKLKALVARVGQQPTLLQLLEAGLPASWCAAQAWQAGGAAQQVAERCGYTVERFCRRDRVVLA